MSSKVLIIDDDSGIVEEVADIVESLGHASESAGCMLSARERLTAGRYACVLLDLEIPVRAGRNIARIRNGLNLLKEIRETYATPVVVMTGHGNDGPDQAVEAMRAGATDYIAKPFNRSKRPFDEIIRGVLQGNGASDSVPTDGNGSPASGRKFEGGALVFHTDRVELHGETIAERSERGNFWAVLHRLREKRPDGRFKPARANELTGIFKSGRATQNTVSSCIGDLRDRITVALRRAGIACGPDDVILSGGPGYRFRDWIVVQDAGGDITGTCGDTNVSDVPAPAGNVPARSPNVPLSDRQHWVLEQLRGGLQLTREQVEKRFGIGPKTAKRDLADAAKRGLVEFVRTPRPGHYRLATR